MPEFAKKEEEGLRFAMKSLGEAAAREDILRDQALSARMGRRCGMAIGIAVAAAVAGTVLGVTFVGPDGPAPRPVASRTNHAKLDAATWISCSSFMGIGDVIGWHKTGEDGTVVLTLEVSEWLKPSQGPEEVELAVRDPLKYGDSKRWKSGEHVLVTVDADKSFVHTYRGDVLTRVRKEIEGALTEASGKQCPSSVPGDA